MPNWQEQYHVCLFLFSRLFCFIIRSNLSHLSEYLLHSVI
ncbi:hypothetical protein PROVRETT_05568 [Providencia rettgeri DSM 1131]|nr:hypothetical protein PROVRETT_05568 [Providencia rettgeri DSM 1131]